MPAEFVIGNQRAKRLSTERAVFLYDIDMARLDPAGEQAFCAALRGDLSALIESEASPLSGIQMVRSLFTAIRRQKHDPNNFYMTQSDGKQVGPVKVEGNMDELNRKFGEAQSYLQGTKNNGQNKGQKNTAKTPATAR